METLSTYRLLGRSGLRVSPLCLGTMTFGTEWGWGADESASKKVLDHYLESGGNFIDTANFYTKGTSEVLCGKFLQGRRDRVVVATKFCLGMHAGDPNAGGAGRKNIITACEESLKRLGTDYIDLYIMHMWDQVTPIEETMSAFDALVRAGKIRYVGFSDTPAWKIAQAHTMAMFRGWEPVISHQVEYHLNDRSIEREAVPCALSLGMGLTPWSPLDGGFLSGRFSRQNLAPGGDSRVKTAEQRKRTDERFLKILDALHEVAKQLGRSCAQVAINWVQNRPGVGSTIIGARTHEQLVDNLKSLEFALSPEQQKLLDDASAIELGFPQDFLKRPGVMENVRSQAKLNAPQWPV